MNNLINAVREKYHPRELTFTRVNAKELLQIAGKSLEELDEMWDDIEDELEKANAVMFPALPDVMEDEAVRIFRLDAPLTRVLIEAVRNTPTPQGDALLAQAIAALNQKPHRSRRQPKPPGTAPRTPQPQNRPKHSRPNPPPQQRQQHQPDPTELSSRKHYTRPLQ